MSDLWDDGGWSPKFTRQLHDGKLEGIQVFFGMLFAHPISLETDDVMIWLPTKNGTFSIKSFYSSLANRRAKPFPYGTVWNS